MSAQLAIQYANREFRKPRSAGLVIGLVAALLVGLGIAGVYRPGHAVTEPAASPRIVGTFTGTYENGVPVYRLPPMEITAVRDSSQG